MPTTASVETRSFRLPGSGVAFDMVKIPGGTFTMGTPDDEAGREADEGPQREVTVQPFWMMSHEVTHDLFQLFRHRDMDTDSTLVDASDFSADAVARPSPPYEDPSHGLGKEGHPAVGMTQWSALHFARWLGNKTGWFFRLPTEAEWEYACRADGPPSDLAAAAWYVDNSGEAFHEVGTKNPNGWKLYDMLGNVSEWTLDQYVEDYFTQVEDGAVSPWIEPTKLHPRTVRGGAYDDDASEMRCGARLKSDLDWKKRDPQLPKSFWWNTDSQFLGFRLMSPVNTPSSEELEMFWFQVLGE